MNGSALSRFASDLKPENLPVFSKTVQHILSITDREETSAKELTGAILADPPMTAHILQVANRVPYNPTAQPIATISQAVLVLGFNPIRNLCLTKALIDSIISSDAHEYLKQLVTQSLHAAFQAQGIAAVSKLPHEDIFIVALLKRLGDIALWSVSPEESDQVAALISGEGKSLEEAQKAIYGFTGKDLSRRLNQDWKLSELLTEALSPHPAQDTRLDCINSGETLATFFTNPTEGELDQTLESVQKIHKNLKSEQLSELVSENLNKARKMAHQYGLPAEEVILSDDTSEEVEESPSTWLEPDQEIQLRILGEISELLDGSPDINLLLEMVSEGIYRGIGMDNVFFALLSPDRQFLNVRFVLGQTANSQLLKHQIKIAEGHIIERCLADNQALWYQPEEGYLLEAELSDLCKGSDFFMRSITIGSRAIGLFYADRAPSKRQLQSREFSAFKQFCQQANLGLAFLKQS
jgi:HD-like signal output (HDOD) protein